MESCLSKLKNVWRNITIEPLAFLTIMILFLGEVPTKDFYVQKACQVNLNYTASVCANLTHHEEIHKETQEYVAGFQAYNGFLQGVPSVFVILFAGPLSDSYGRKPFIALPLVGLLLLNLVFVINSIWFHELTVEYLLVECIQDFTGGQKLFKLAVTCYLIDVTSIASRTPRICFLEATIGLSIMIASPLGSIIKSNFGFTALYSTVLVLVILALIGCYFLTESIHLVNEEKKQAMLEEREKSEIKCDKGFCGDMLAAVISGFKALVRGRPERKHIWCFILITNIIQISESFGPNLFYFYQLQYKMESETFAWLLSTWAVGSVFSQTFVIPFLTIKLGLRDTVIIMLCCFFNSLDVFLETFMSQVWFLFFCWGFLQWFWDCGFTCSVSAISKLVEPSEIGKCLSLVTLFRRLVGVGATPAFNLIYQATLRTYPTTFMYVAILFFQIALALTIYTHVDMKRKEKKYPQEEQMDQRLPINDKTKTSNLEE